MIKVCTKCGKDEVLVSFELQRRQCKSCRKVYFLAKRKEYYWANRDKAILYTKLWREANQDKKLAHRKAEYAKNAIQAKEAAKTYRKENPAKINAWSRKHQLAKLQRTPKWLTEFDLLRIECFYSVATMRNKNDSQEWQVDHIIPLQGKMVSGLHVPTNLRVIPASENRAKSNKFEIN